MTFKVDDGADGRRVFLAGEIDLERSPEARKVLLAAVRGGKPVTVDLADVSYMDSSGIASLVEALQQANTRGVEFALDRVSGQVARILALARLDQVFTIRSQA